MDSAFGIQNTMLDSVVLLAGRLLLAWIFVHEGVFLATNFDAASAGMAKLGVPGLALIPTIALQLLAGIAIAVGWHARLGAAMLGLFCLATAVLFHTNFANRNELLHFEKDFAIAGGMFVLMLRGAGGFSVDTRTGHRRRFFGSPSSSPGLMNTFARFVRT
jgi:putative oxidoreductase